MVNSDIRIRIRVYLRFKAAAAIIGDAALRTAPSSSWPTRARPHNTARAKACLSASASFHSATWTAYATTAAGPGPFAMQ
jgi:hypothetical protein